MGFVDVVFADEGVIPNEEYQKIIKSSSVVNPLNDDAFGQNLRLFDLTASFHALDVSLPGNNSIPVQIGREFPISFGADTYRGLPGFADWNIDIPRIYGDFLQEKGWITKSSSPYARCSIPSKPDAALENLSGTLKDIWHGYYLHVSSENESELLVNNQPKSAQVSDGNSYPWVTAEKWEIGCLAGTDNGYKGESFFALSPQGQKFYFNHAMVHSIAPVVYQSQSPMGQAVLRVRVNFLVSRIEDRFGGWVNYSYSGDRLVSINSSDGRKIIFNYDENGNVQFVRAGERTWTYIYETHKYPPNPDRYRLKSVILPDGTSWRYNITAGSLTPLFEVDLPKIRTCTKEPAQRYGDFDFQVVNPAGLTGDFHFSYERSHLTHAPLPPCQNGKIVDVPHPWVPAYFDRFQLYRKKVSGPGLAEQKWVYSNIEPGIDYYTTGSATDPCPTCVPSKTTIVKEPDGSSTEYEFGYMYGLNAGRLLGVKNFNSNGSLARSTINEYVSDDQTPNQPFPDQIGATLLELPNPLANINRPLKRVTIVEGDTYFVRDVMAFDNFARPTKEQLYSAWYSRTELKEYYDDLTKWILGQSAKSTNADTGIVEAQISYDARAMPVQRWSFGKLQQTFTYNSDGTLATATDGNQRVTRFADWKLGIPQAIHFADTTVMLADVNDAGWITAVTDTNGGTTQYEYDPMGRLTSIAYPAGDSIAWNATTQVFEQVNASEYGLPEGHWRQTVTTGKARKLTYFDAMWRPLLTREYDADNEAGTQRFQRFAYDHEGRTTFTSYPGSSDALSVGTWITYDALGRTTSVSRDSELSASTRLTTLTEYLPGNQTRVTDPRGNSTMTGYQVFDKPDYTTPTWIQHPEGATTEINRDVFGKPLSIRRRDASGTVSVTRSYVYDTYQQLCKTVEPETGATANGYDAAGNLVWSAAGLALPSTTSCDADSAFASARRVDRSYDVRNRIKALSFPDGNGNQAWSYWPDGAVKQITTTNNGVATYNSYAYNKRRLLIAESQGQADGETWALGYAYDANGNLAAHRYPSGQTVDYAPNALGQPTQAGSYATGVSYYPNGAIKQFTYGNGIVHTMTQNARQLPDTSQDAYGGTAFLSDGYDYDANGNVAGISDGATGRNQRGNRTMTYDGMDRLIKAESPMFGTATYSYDVLDNLTHVIAPGRDHYYCYDANWQLTNVKTGGCGGSTVIGMSYDPQGNLSNKNGQAFVFDYGNRLRQATGKETYRYDGNGRRTLALQSAGNIGSLYDQSGALRFQKNQRQSKSTDYILLGGSLVAEADWPLGQLASVKDYVNWNPVSGATRYVVEESVDGVTWTSVYDGSQGNWTSLARPAGTYSYRVTACTADGNCTTASNVKHDQRPAVDIVPLLYQLLLNS
nr:RHS repeat protein [Xanthomonas sp. D-93]